jgi:hypothetical protein
MKIILFFLLVLICISLSLNYALSRRIDNLTVTLVRTQDFQDKYLYDVLRHNNLKLLTISEFVPPEPRTWEDIKK